MYQSLMLMSQQLQLILVRDLYEEISDIEQRFKALQQGLIPINYFHISILVLICRWLSITINKLSMSKL